MKKKKNQMKGKFLKTFYCFWFHSKFSKGEFVDISFTLLMNAWQHEVFQSFASIQWNHRNSIGTRYFIAFILNSRALKFVSVWFDFNSSSLNRFISLKNASSSHHYTYVCFAFFIVFVFSPQFSTATLSSSRFRFIYFVIYVHVRMTRGIFDFFPFQFQMFDFLITIELLFHMLLLHSVFNLFLSGYLSENSLQVHAETHMRVYRMYVQIM